jgi:hypothetical protein
MWGHEVAVFSFGQPYGGSCSKLLTSDPVPSLGHAFVLLRMNFSDEHAL